MQPSEFLSSRRFVVPYSDANLHQAMAYGAHKGQLDWPSRTHPTVDSQEIEAISDLATVKYLHGYLYEYCRERDFRAQTIVVERDYIDKDFMKEYAGYYASAYQPTEKKTTRLHFFSTEFDADQLESMLAMSVEQGGELEGLARRMSSGYLGFVVVRPMQRNFVGRTCLKHYPRDKNPHPVAFETGPQTQAALKHKRHYTVLREYHVNLFGVPLTVSSIAFQEQDSVVGVCASSAIYALLHGVKSTFDTKLLCGLEITRMANQYSGSTTQVAEASLMRALPNTGLTLGQMYQTLSEVDLTPLMVGVGKEPPERLNSVATLYAYLSAGLPVLSYVVLVAKSVLEKSAKELALPNDDTGDAERIRFHEERVAALNAAPRHAFTITGYSLDSLENLKRMEDEDGKDARTHLPQMAQLVNKVYVHCDRIGPFSKFWIDHDHDWLSFRPNALHEPIDKDTSTDHAYAAIAKGAQVLAIPLVFLIPINEKLRLSFEAALDVANAINSQRGNNVEPQGLVWDIKIAGIASLKSAWRNEASMDKILKVRVLQRDLPRFCWRVVATMRSGFTAFEVLLDCTAVEIASSILAVIPHRDDGALLLMAIADVIGGTLKDLDAQASSKTAPRVLKRLAACINEALPQQVAT